MKIIVNNGWFKKRFIGKVFKQFIIYTSQPSNIEVSVSFLSLVQIQELNNKFRNIDKPTDVLSFPSLELKANEIINADKFKTSVNYDSGNIMLGDIFICNELVSIQAHEYNHSYKRELAFLALHGFMHLFGYDHETSEDEQQMNDIADNILNKLNIKRS